MSTVAADLAELLNNCSTLLILGWMAHWPRFVIVPLEIAMNAQNALRVTGELDERAWDIQEKVDDGALLKHAYLEAFRKARAAASVGFAPELNPLQAALEAVYEARAAVADLEVVRAVIDSALMD